MTRKKLPEKFQIWIDARKRFRLSHVQIQMARELGMNPQNFGKLANQDQEPWKVPLPDFIERIYRETFGKARPDQVRTIEQVVAAKDKKKAERRAARAYGDTRIETDLARIRALSEKREKKNLEFRAFLKSECNPQELDELVHRLYREVSATIDCLACANCCREIVPALDQDDAERFARGLGMPLEEFAGEYLRRDDEKEFFSPCSPCPFLDGKRCRNYEARPDDCRSYPHLHKADIMSRLMAVVTNYDICPIVFNVYERLKRKLKGSPSTGQ